MTVRFYLSAAAAPWTPPSTKGMWGDRTRTANVYAMSSAKAGVNTLLTANKTVTTNPYSVLVHRHVSPPLVGGVAPVTNTITVCHARMQSNTLAGMSVAWNLYVTVGNTDEVRGAPQSYYVGATKWPAVMTAISFTLASDVPVTIARGDRVVLELGYGSATATTTYNGQMRVGGTSATDLATTGTVGVTTDSPWIDFIGSDAVYATIAEPGAGPVRGLPLPPRLVRDQAIRRAANW